MAINGRYFAERPSKFMIRLEGAIYQPALVLSDWSYGRVEEIQCVEGQHGVYNIRFNPSADGNLAGQILRNVTSANIGMPMEMFKLILGIGGIRCNKDLEGRVDHHFVPGYAKDSLSKAMYLAQKRKADHLERAMLSIKGTPRRHREEEEEAKHFGRIGSYKTRGRYSRRLSSPDEFMSFKKLKKTYVPPEDYVDDYNDEEDE